MENSQGSIIIKLARKKDMNAQYAGAAMRLGTKRVMRRREKEFG